MDQLLASTSFDQVYQPNSRWFPSRSPDSASIPHCRKAVVDEPRVDGPAKRQRLSHGEHEKPRLNNDMDLIAGRDLEDPSYCAKSFLLLSTLASQEQDLLMPVAGIQVPDWGLAADHGEGEDQPYSDHGSETDHIDCERRSRSDLKRTLEDTTPYAVPTGSVTTQAEEAALAVSSSNYSKTVMLTSAKISKTATARSVQVSLAHTLDQDTVAENDTGSPKITGDLEKDLGLVDDDIGWL